jgi:hypothetical protein
VEILLTCHTGKTSRPSLPLARSAQSLTVILRRSNRFHQK